MNEDEYYDAMCTIIPNNKSIEMCNPIWHDCFMYSMEKLDLKSQAYDHKSTTNSVLSENIFNDFNITNPIISSNESIWNAFIQTLNYDGSLTFKDFQNECFYISDRMNLKRLFGCHRIYLSLKDN
jgi:hypothetical protein